MNTFHKAVVAATTAAELEKVVDEVIGSSNLMEFARFDAGEVLRKERGGQGPKFSASSSGIRSSCMRWRRPFPTPHRMHR